MRIATASSMRPTRTGTASNGMPLALYSGSFQPAPMPISTALAQHLECRELLVEDGRMAEVVVEHEHADPERLGDRGDRRERGHRRKHVPEVIGYGRRRRR